MHTHIPPSIPIHSPVLTPLKKNQPKQVTEKKHFHKKCINHSCRDAPHQIYTAPKTYKTSHNQHRNAFTISSSYHPYIFPTTQNNNYKSTTCTPSLTHPQQLRNSIQHNYNSHHPHPLYNPTTALPATLP